MAAELGDTGYYRQARFTHRATNTPSHCVFFRLKLELTHCKNGEALGAIMRTPGEAPVAVKASNYGRRKQLLTHVFGVPASPTMQAPRFVADGREPPTPACVLPLSDFR